MTRSSRHARPPPHTWIQLGNINEALAGTKVCVVTDCGGLCDSLLINVTAWLGSDDQRSGIEALCSRWSMAASHCTMRRVHPAAVPADGLTESES